MFQRNYNPYNSTHRGDLSGTSDDNQNYDDGEDYSDPSDPYDQPTPAPNQNEVDREESWDGYDSAREDYDHNGQGKSEYDERHRYDEERRYEERRRYEEKWRLAQRNRHDNPSSGGAVSSSSSSSGGVGFESGSKVHQESFDRYDENGYPSSYKVHPAPGVDTKGCKGSHCCYPKCFAEKGSRVSFQ